MRLIENAFENAKKDLKLNWHEIEGYKSNHYILECYASVNDLGISELDLDDSDIPWCSCYMNKKIQECGGSGTRSAMARSWLRWGKKSDGRIGDIVILQRGNNGYSGHVGFIYAIYDDIIEILGGNQSDTVCIKKYNTKDILGFRTSLD